MKLKESPTETCKKGQETTLNKQYNMIFFWEKCVFLYRESHYKIITQNRRNTKKFRQKTRRSGGQIWDGKISFRFRKNKIHKLFLGMNYYFWIFGHYSLTQKDKFPEIFFTHVRDDNLFSLFGQKVFLPGPMVNLFNNRLFLHQVMAVKY